MIHLFWSLFENYSLDEANRRRRLKSTKTHMQLLLRNSINLDPDSDSHSFWLLAPKSQVTYSILAKSRQVKSSDSLAGCLRGFAAHWEKKGHQIKGAKVASPWKSARLKTNNIEQDKAQIQITGLADTLELATSLFQFSFACPMVSQSGLLLLMANGI